MWVRRHWASLIGWRSGEKSAASALIGWQRRMFSCENAAASTRIGRRQRAAGAEGPELEDFLAAAASEQQTKVRRPAAAKILPEFPPYIHPVALRNNKAFWTLNIISVVLILFGWFLRKYFKWYGYIFYFFLRL